jgi:hypothetical protein
MPRRLCRLRLRRRSSAYSGSSRDARRSLPCESPPGGAPPHAQAWKERKPSPTPSRGFELVGLFHFLSLHTFFPLSLPRRGERQLRGQVVVDSSPPSASPDLSASEAVSPGAAFSLLTHGILALTCGSRRGWDPTCHGEGT